MAETHLICRLRLSRRRPASPLDSWPWRLPGSVTHSAGVWGSAVHPVSHHAGGSSFWWRQGSISCCCCCWPHCSKKERFLMNCQWSTILFFFFAPGCRFEAAVMPLKLRINKLGDWQEGGSKKKGINNVLKTESLRIQLPSNLPQFNLYFQKHVFTAYKRFNIQMAVFLFLQEVILLSKKKKISTLLQQKKKKKLPTQCYS